MATALCTTEEKENFQRLARLLMCGGVTLLREKFDTFQPPAGLSKTLKKTATKTQLQGAKLSKPEWDCVYPSAGIYGESTDFDISLLFKLLRTICFLSSPTTGWDKLPNRTDHTLEADLVRIKYYRNSVCCHNHTREITDTDFANLWREISEALLRIAGTISTLRRDKLEKDINNFLHDPLTQDEERYATELQSWYKKDMDIKEEIEKLGNKMEQMNAENQEEFEKLGNKMEQMDIKMHTFIESFKAGGTHAIPQPQEANLQPSTSESASQELQQNFQTSVGIWQVILSFKASVSLLFEYLKKKLGVDVQDCRSGSLVITVSCSSLESLVGLWNDYRSGHLNKVVQETLVTEEVLKELCLSEVKLKTIISDMEYKANKKFLNQKTGQWKKKKKKKEKKEIPIPVVPTVIKPAALGQWKKEKKKKRKKEIPIPVVPTVIKPAALETVAPPVPWSDPLGVHPLPGHHPGTDDVYNMTALPRGITLIINNKLFAKHSFLSTHHGAEKDVRKVEELFTALGFTVHTKENLTELDSVTCQDHSGYDCFVLWLMSHGQSGEVFGSKCVPLPIQEAMDMLNNCKTLRGKPKLFFINTDRSHKEDKYKEMDACIAEDSTCTFPIAMPSTSPHLSLHEEMTPMMCATQPNSSHVDPVLKLPATRLNPMYADFLIVYYTVNNYLLYKHLDLESFFIRGLVEAFQERAVHDDIFEVVKVAHQKVLERKAFWPSVEDKGVISVFYQMPTVTSTLLKRLCF